MRFEGEQSVARSLAFLQVRQEPREGLEQEGDGLRCTLEKNHCRCLVRKARMEAGRPAKRLL